MIGARIKVEIELIKLIADSRVVLSLKNEFKCTKIEKKKVVHNKPVSISDPVALQEEAMME